MDFDSNKDDFCLEKTLKCNLTPVKLLNKIGNNMCWWNSFAQLFASTRNLSIINTMYKFTESHNCENSNECWYCKILNDFIILMTDTNDSTNIDFNKYLFDSPDYINDNDNDKLIDHPFIIFERNKQHDAFEGCNKWFEVIDKIAHDIYDMFSTTMIIQTICNICNHNRDDNIVSENVLSVSIDKNAINSVQDAIQFFQKEELINVDCNINGCTSKLGKRTFQFFHSPNYLMINLKRFAKKPNGKLIKVHKNIEINESIIIKNGDFGTQKQYSLIGVLHHIGNTIDSGHYICQCLINNFWYEINDNTYNICLKPYYSTTCYITLWKLIENNLAMNNNDMNNSMLNNTHSQSQQSLSFQFQTANYSNVNSEKKKSKKNASNQNSYKILNQRKKPKRGPKRHVSPNAPLYEKPKDRKKRKDKERRKLDQNVKNKNKSIDNNNNNNNFINKQKNCKVLSSSISQQSPVVRTYKSARLNAKSNKKNINEKDKSTLDTIPQPIIPSDYDTQNASQSQSQSQPQLQFLPQYESLQIIELPKKTENNQEKSKTKKKSAFITTSYKTSRRKHKRGVKRQFSPDQVPYEKPPERKKRKVAEKRKQLSQNNNKNNIDANNNQKLTMYPQFYILKNIDDFDDKIEAHDCGRRNITCNKCKSQMWIEEHLSKSSTKNNIFGLCCLNGDIEIPLLPSPPDEIKYLLEKNDDESKFFQKNIRGFNSALAMASLGVKQQHLPKGGPSIFKIQGTVSHLIGSLLPNDEYKENPKFVQIYLFDTENEINNRMNMLDECWMN
jgi:hypothetical protein